MENLIKKRFVGKVLQEEGDRLWRNQGMILGKRLRFHTGNLMEKRSIRVSEADNMDGQLAFSHVPYERFLDMKRSVNRKRTEGTRLKRGYRIHNRFVYGTYAAIAGRLMYELTEEACRNITDEIKSGING